MQGALGAQQPDLETGAPGPRRSASGERVGAAPRRARAARTATAAAAASAIEVEAAVEDRPEDEVGSRLDRSMRAASACARRSAAGRARRSAAAAGRARDTRATASATPPGDAVAVLGEERRVLTRQALQLAAGVGRIMGDVDRRGGSARAPTRSSRRISADCSATQPSRPISGSSAWRTSPRRGARAMIRTAGRKRSCASARGPTRSACRQTRHRAELLRRGEHGTANRIPRRPPEAAIRRRSRQRPAEQSAKTRGRPPHQLDQLCHRGRLAGNDLVGVVGDEPEQRERQLELAAQHRLGPARLADGDDAAGGELGDLAGGVEAGAVDMSVAPAVTGTARPACERRRQSAASISRASTGRRAAPSGRAAGSPGPVKERAQRPVRQPVGDEVQVVEDDQRAELERRVDGAADGAADDRRRARARAAPRCSRGG